MGTLQTATALRGAAAEHAAVFSDLQRFASWGRPVIRCTRCSRVQFINSRSRLCVACHCILQIDGNQHYGVRSITTPSLNDEDVFGRRICIRLRDLRILKGLSQPQLAEGVPCVRTYITKYENGYVIPKLDTLEKLATALGVGLGRLCDESIPVERLAEDGLFAGGVGQELMDKVLPLVGCLDAISRHVIVQAAIGMCHGERVRCWR